MKFTKLILPSFSHRFLITLQQHLVIVSFNHSELIEILRSKSHLDLSGPDFEPMYRNVSMPLRPSIEMTAALSGHVIKGISPYKEI